MAGFTAKFWGTCINCGRSINPGDRVSALGRGRPSKGSQKSRRYFHTHCPASQPAPQPVKVEPVIEPVIEPEPEVEPVIETPVVIPQPENIALATKWVDVVQEVRRCAMASDAQVVISPRASMKGAQLLRAGVAPSMVVEAVFGRYRHLPLWNTIGVSAENFARLPGAHNQDAEAKWQDRLSAAGMQHKAFATLLRLFMALSPDDRNIWLAGPAGSGKTTAAKMVARAIFGTDESYEFNGAIDTEYKLSGFIDANGRIVSTAFRRVWENGGVYLFDECDASMPGALLAFNAALANGIAAFPDGPIARHPDAYVAAAANTWGFGGDANYVGRAKLDAAFLDRFLTVSWGYDEALERHIALAA